METMKVNSIKQRYKSNRAWKRFKSSIPLTIMAIPALVLMFLFKYLPMAGTVLAFKKFSVQKGIFGSEFIGLKNFEFLFKSADALIITRNTLGYNIAFIILDLAAAICMAIALNELLNKRRAKLLQTVFMAPYFMSWVVVSFIAFALFSSDDGLLNHLLNNFGIESINWYSEKKYWPFILVLFASWKTAGYSTVMYLGTLVSIPNDYYEAAIMDGATKWQQIKYITLPCLKIMMIVLTTLAIGRIFYSDFGLFYQLPRNSGPLFDTTNVIDTYVYRGLKETSNIGMSAAANLYQSVIGFICIFVSNLAVRKIDKESALF